MLFLDLGQHRGEDLPGRLPPGGSGKSHSRIPTCSRALVTRLCTQRRRLPHQALLAFHGGHVLDDVAWEELRRVHRVAAGQNIDGLW